MNALKCRTLRAMSSCHCGQTLLGSMSQNSTLDNFHTGRLVVRVVKYTCALYAGKWPTVRMAFNGVVLDLCNPAVSEKTPQIFKYFDLHCPLST